MSTESSATASSDVLEDLVRELRTEGFEAQVAAHLDQTVVVYAADPRLDPWDDPNEDRQIEIVRIQHRDGHLHCPWLPGPIADSELEELGSLLKTLMQTRGY